MKLLGITAGRPGGNSEILMKEALMAAEEEYNAETAWFNLHDCKILPCTGCEACTMRVAMRHEPPECIHKGKDDMDLIMAELAAADGLIVSIPSFCMQPQGIWRIFTDRWLPYEWALQKQAGLVDKAPDRVAGLITVGGSTENWMTMTLASLNVSMFMQSIKVVDMMMATGCARPGHVVLKDNFIQQAHQLGLNVAYSLTIPYDEVKYLGKEQGWCPVCHCNLMKKGKPHWDGLSFKYECAMCGAGGDFELRDGELVFVLAENGLEHCRIFTEGRENHGEEIGLVQRTFFENIEEAKKRIAKYKAYNPRKVI
ncbi:MAG: flavodoxin family protein [Oscillospiraceae bacterium]|jgi:multimeric flavodoxin WrbA